MVAKSFPTVALALACANLWAQAPGQSPPTPPDRDIGIDQNLDTILPLNTEWTDEHGKSVRLGDYFKDKPVMVVPVFYGCKGICLMTLDGVIGAVKGMKNFEPGRDYEIVTFSVHPKETPEMAAGVEKETLAKFNRPGLEDGWHFLVGKQESIQPLTKALGFRYTYDPATGLIDHPAAIMIATPDGHISKYFIDVVYVPKMVLNSLKDAGQQRIGAVTTEAKWFGCLNRDLRTGEITLNVMRISQIAGGLTLAIVAFAIVRMSLKNRRAALPRPTKPEGSPQV